MKKIFSAGETIVYATTAYIIVKLNVIKNKYRK
jgi:hypothetical protein